MDLNIGAALWCAAGACGLCIIRGPSKSRQKTTASTSSSLPSCEAEPCPKHPVKYLPAHQAASSHAEGDGSEGSPSVPVQGQRQLQGLWRSSTKAMLVGQGADEAFGGYGRYRTRFREAVCPTSNGLDVGVCRVCLLAAWPVLQLAPHGLCAKLRGCMAAARQPSPHIGRDAHDDSRGPQTEWREETDAVQIPAVLLHGHV